MPRIDRPTPRVPPSNVASTTIAGDALPSLPVVDGAQGPSSIPHSSPDIPARFEGLRSGTSVPTPAANHAANMREVLQTYFAPYDDPIRHELGLIREVIEAKKADPRSFSDGENPFTIKYAVYNLRNPEVVNALMEAAREGVDVQILIEHHQLDPAKDWNTSDETLIAAGFEFSETHKGLTDAQKQELDLIGIQGSGLMHLKTRLFTRPDPTTGEPIEKMITGSMNPGDEVEFNNETFHLITDPQLISRYKAKYDAVLNGTELPNVWNDDAAVNVLFTPAKVGPQPADKILELVDKEQEAIFMTVFSLRNVKSKKHRDGLIEKLKAAVARGVEVVIVTDKKQSDGVDANGNRIAFDDNMDDILKAAGIPVYECINTGGPFNAMHQKSAIFGLTEPKVVTDCGNWTAAALGTDTKPARNEESLLFIDSMRLDGGATSRRFLSNFLHLLRTYEGQQDAGTPGADALLERFMALPAWPKVKVDFDVVAKTHWGQEVYITGDHEALGTWTKSGPGIKLNTTGGTYPVWSTDTSLELPFGLALQYKVVKRDASSGELDWETGENQLLVVDSGDLNRAGADHRTGSLQVNGAFRSL